MKKTLGGERLGSGNKMNVSMRNYSRSTHNLTESFRSSMAPGVLYPFYVAPAMNGDTFDIDLTAMAKTLPTNGPLMGQFKLQMDMFLCPVRLYQGILHNNPINIGLQMKDVKLPKVELHTIYNKSDATKFKVSQICPTSLAKYVGISGIVEATQTDRSDGKWHAKRTFSALPFLMYYDIFKNYYANKQEENAYVISGKTIQGANVKFALITSQIGVPGLVTQEELYTRRFTYWNAGEFAIRIWSLKGEEDLKNNFLFYLANLEEEEEGGGYTENPVINFVDIEGVAEDIEDYRGYLNEFNVTYGHDENGYYVELKGVLAGSNNAIRIHKGIYGNISTDIELKAFPLENIDKMRTDILSLNKISDELVIRKSTAYLPYKAIVDMDENGMGHNLYEMNGLVTKTYQSDIFNNWVNTEWIDGENGINAITTIDTSDGLKLDTLNLAQKVYNMLNRIATSGGSYQDWQEAVWSQKVIAHCESPIYCGGLSGEIGFEELASSVATETDPLGTLGGKGKLASNKGGHLVIKVNEPSFIMGIASITPRIDYCEGNAWYMTELETMDDFHKPALDGIGFQDLIGERMAWWDTIYTAGGTFERHAIGKQPAWLNYMTAYDKVYGDFARPDGYNFMVLARTYTAKKNNQNYYEVQDFTTYIDPSKYNYAFAQSALYAQNFWLQVLTKVTARRLMSAKIIPNL